MSARTRLCRWGSWFAVANAGLLAVVGLRYLWYYSPLEPVVAWAYAVIAYVGHLSALAYILLFINGDVNNTPRGELVRAFDAATQFSASLMYAIAAMIVVFGVIVVVFSLRRPHE